MKGSSNRPGGWWTLLGCWSIAVTASPPAHGMAVRVHVAKKLRGSDRRIVSSETKKNRPFVVLNRGGAEVRTRMYVAAPPHERKQQKKYRRDTQSNPCHGRRSTLSIPFTAMLCRTARSVASPGLHDASNTTRAHQRRG